MRYSLGGAGVLWINGKTQAERIRFGVRDGEDWAPAAMGVEIHCDALIGQVATPDFSTAPQPDERSAWLQHQVLTTTDLPGEMSSFDRVLVE